MQPTPESVHVDAILTNISVAYRNRSYIADRVFPAVRVAKQSDKYFIFPKGAWFRDEAGMRAPGGAANRGGYILDTDNYFCNEWAFEHPIPKERIENADNPLRPWQTGVNFATDKILLRKERLVAAAVMNTANWTTTNDVDALWAPTGDTNTFMTDIETAKEVIRQQTGGLVPNVLLMDSKTFKALKQVAAIIDRIKYTGTSGKPADVTPQTLASLFELDEVLIGRAIYSSAKETKAGTDYTAVDIWEKNATKGSAFLFYRPSAPALEEPSAGYVFDWPSTEMGMTQQLSQDNFRQVEKYWEDQFKQWVVRVSERLDPKVVAADAGYLFYDTLVT